MNEANVRLDLHKHAIEFHIIPYTDESECKKGSLLVKLDHTFCDGLSIVSVICCLADNFSLDIFPKAIKRNFTIDYKEALKTILKFIFLGWLVFLRICLQKSKVKILSSERTGYASIGVPKEFVLSDIKKISKSLKITINELMVTLVSASLKKMDKDSSDFVLCIPLGNSTAPKSLSSLSLRNKMTGISTKLSMIDCPIKNNKDAVVNELKNLMSNKFVSDTSFYLAALLCDYLPITWYKSISQILARNIDLTISNVPGPTEILVYNGCKVKSIVPFNSLGPNKCFIVITSYCNTLYVIPTFDRNQNVDPEEFSKCFEDILNDTLKQIAKDEDEEKTILY